MLPMMVAPALVGLMYRLVLHEFVGAGALLSLLLARRQPGLSRRRRTSSGRWSSIETLQWTPFAFLLFYMAYPAIPPDLREAAAIDGASAMEHPALRRAAADAADDRDRVLHPLHRRLPGVRQHLCADRQRGRAARTTSLSIYIYEAFFKQGAIGVAVAASVLLFAAVPRACSRMLNRLAGRRRA